METEFYKSIPPEIREKLQEYCDKSDIAKGFELSPLSSRLWLSGMFTWSETPEGKEFWRKHHYNNTFPIWSDELNRFIDPPTNIDLNENPNKFYPL